MTDVMAAGFLRPAWTSTMTGTTTASLAWYMRCCPSSCLCSWIAARNSVVGIWRDLLLRELRAWLHRSCLVLSCPFTFYTAVMSFKILFPHTGFTNEYSFPENATTKRFFDDAWPAQFPGVSFDSPTYSSPACADLGIFLPNQGVTHVVCRYNNRRCF